jgi:hypothetical protein
MASGDEKLWAILNDNLDTLRGSGRLPEAVRVGEAALDLAKRAFPVGNSNIALSLEKLGQLHDQAGNHAAARPYLLKAHEVLRKGDPPDHSAIYRPPGGSGFSSIISATPKRRSRSTNRRSKPARNCPIWPTPISARC